MTLAMIFFLTGDLLDQFKEQELGAKSGPKDMDNTRQRVANVREFLLLCCDGVPRRDLLALKDQRRLAVCVLYCLLYIYYMSLLMSRLLNTSPNRVSIHNIHHLFCPLFSPMSLHVTSSRNRFADMKVL